MQNQHNLTYGPGIFAFFFITGLVIFIYMVIQKKKSYSNPMNEFLANTISMGTRSLDNKLIDYYHQVLSKYVDYYRQLDKRGRKKFIDRLHAFIENMEFRGADGQEINLKVCTLCAVPAIQISMGLDKYLFDTYHTIIVYPRQFYSETQGRYVKGGVGKRDVIFFSYDDLLKGYEIPDDALNLGLHEMAHAVHAEYFDDTFEAKFPKWERVAVQELAKLRYEKDPVLRNYAGQNVHELFAVCVETFFEQPAAMKKQTPALFDVMCDLLNQRPGEVAAKVSY